MKQLTIIGAGWAGLAAAVAATQAGWQVSVYEAASLAGGRARRLPHNAKHSNSAHTPDTATLDNGQHVLIGAYTHSLALMRTVGLDPEALLQRLPLDLRFANGEGLCVPNGPLLKAMATPQWPMTLALPVGVARAKGWTWSDKHRFLRAAWGWQQAGFACNPAWTVAQLCEHSALSPTVCQHVIEPLCLSALNTAMHQASAAVFLRVLHDALLGGTGSADLLVPRVDLGALLPDACVSWLLAQGAHVQLGQRINAADLAQRCAALGPNDAVLLACPSWEAARLVTDLQEALPPRSALPSEPALPFKAWAQTSASLSHRAIATVYLRCTSPHFAGLPRPMMALHSHAQAPAQFVFDRHSVNRQPGLLAAVVSDCHTERDTLSAQVLQQVQSQIGERFELGPIEHLQTLVEKRATLACTPQLQRPGHAIAPQLWACGDYLQGPYPSTLEGAVRSGQQAVASISGHS